jgi:hypothetical protein
LRGLVRPHLLACARLDALPGAAGAVRTSEPSASGICIRCKATRVGCGR